MDGFKDSTRMKYMTGGPVKKALGGTLNEKGKRATLAEMEAEDRRMGSSMPAKKAVGPSSVAVSKVLDGMAKKAAPASGIGGGALAGAAAGALAGAAARAAAKASKAVPRGMGAMSDREMQMVRETARKVAPRGMGAMSDREMQMVREAAKKAVPSYSDRPMIRRSKGGLTAMPKGKC
jgi:hypothetical protein